MGSLGVYLNCVADTNDGKQKNKNHEDFPWTENKVVFCFTSSLSSTRSFDWNLDSINIWTTCEFIWLGKVYIWLSVWEFQKLCLWQPCLNNLMYVENWETDHLQHDLSVVKVMHRSDNQLNCHSDKWPIMPTLEWFSVCCIVSEQKRDFNESSRSYF